VFFSCVCSCVFFFFGVSFESELQGAAIRTGKKDDNIRYFETNRQPPSMGGMSRLLQQWKLIWEMVTIVVTA
jgi:hypothetical protein